MKYEKQLLNYSRNEHPNNISFEYNQQLMIKTTSQAKEQTARTFNKNYANNECHCQTPQLTEVKSQFYFVNNDFSRIEEIMID